MSNNPLSFMENKNEFEDVVAVPEFKPELGEDGTDKTDWKAKAEEARQTAIKNHGIAQRYKTKAEKAKESKVEPPVKPNEPISNDLGEKAYLAVNGVKTADEVEFFNKLKKETGKSADALLESTYFQTEFKDFKEKKSTANATPTGSKRSNNSSVDTVEYWLAKGEMPPASEVQLRRDVVNARMKQGQSKGVFYNS